MSDIAFWVSPDDKIIPVPMNHIGLIVTEPEKFGLTKEYIKKIYKKHGEPVGLEGDAREELMIELIKDGWMRLRYWHKNDSMTFQIADYKAVERVPDVAAELLKKKQASPHSQARVIDLSGAEYPDNEFRDIKDVAYKGFKKRGAYKSLATQYHERKGRARLLKAIGEYKPLKRLHALIG